MSSLSRRWIAIGAIFAALGVALGAFGSHVLPARLAQLGYEGSDLIRRQAIWETAIRYQMYHALALILVGLALQHRDTRAWRIAPWAFLSGIILFSGSLKVLTFVPPEWNRIGLITPVGGAAFIVGWLTLAVCALKRGHSGSVENPEC